MRAVTPYELAYGREYTGALCEFGEPIFGYHRTAAKSSARWKRAIFLGKIDPQDSYLLHDGHNLVLTRSVRRISTSWKGHLAFYVNFTCWSWNYKPGFGGRVVPTKEQRAAVGASFNQPEGQIEPSAFFDEEAEQVRQKFLEEQKEEEEAGEMALHDKPAVGNLEVEQKPAAVTFGETVVVEDDEQPRTPPVSTQEGYFCLQTTLSLRSTKQGSTEPGLYIYIYICAIDLSYIYSHVPASLREAYIPVYDIRPVK